MTAKNPKDKVRELQRTLFTAAKRSRSRRFHALMDRIWRSDVLLEAWRRVRSNRGAAGIDGETLSMIEQQGVDEFLRELGETLQKRRYRPQPVRRQYIPKMSGCCGCFAFAVVSGRRKAPVADAFAAPTGPTRDSCGSTGSTSCLARFATREVRMQREKIIGKPCAGNPHARFERGPQVVGSRSNRTSIT